MVSSQLDMPCKNNMFLLQTDISLESKNIFVAVQNALIIAKIYFSMCITNYTPYKDRFGTHLFKIFSKMKSFVVWLVMSKNLR